MISRLPKWVEAGAFVLAFIAGSVNAVGLLGFKHQAVSHVSGTATLLGTLLADSPLDALHLAGVIVSFLLGATLSGLLLNDNSLKLGRHYDSLLLIEALFLLATLWFLNEGQLYGHYLASAACGLQNALATTYSGAVVRTTHMSGIVTDLGIMLGQGLKRRGFDKRKAILFLLLIAGFISGGTAGGLLFEHFHFFALLLPVLLCLILALIYRLYRFKRRLTLNHQRSA
ncbi:YoaK family protein [Oceanospirillum sp.]|uniref:YoaK family protein n=1 Tax=Oceanospirillum sp. TaxID=2021254 RepID=UPI003A8EB24A